MWGGETRFCSKKYATFKDEMKCPKYHEIEKVGKIGGVIDCIGRGVKISLILQRIPLVITTTYSNQKKGIYFKSSYNNVTTSSKIINSLQKVEVGTGCKVTEKDYTIGVEHGVTYARPMKITFNTLGLYQKVYCNAFVTYHPLLNNFPRVSFYTFVIFFSIKTLIVFFCVKNTVKFLTKSGSNFASFGICSLFSPLKNLEIMTDVKMKKRQNEKEDFQVSFGTKYFSKFGDLRALVSSAGDVMVGIQANYCSLVFSKRFW
ncbi:hypothetical protein EIN_169010 [Entamoeba invadens IP1]|uniref:Uncharacterized protein n=1 Tax=Entamoeba invadens IP1 TaxID=370355 RepID=A0A0A1TVP7_ENTIV|nr:hypothetical protein EIN_169010 [Entamoeba invadens IP1]ELP84486.1 hypothetical protein EIN_169010 [Entamoeba invadens IP1]|eukprot:XP_004183832.1 hypothetical protein EIN_169010 [Entamoeba invadens IP1]